MQYNPMHQLMLLAIAPVLTLVLIGVMWIISYFAGDKSNV